MKARRAIVVARVPHAPAPQAFAKPVLREDLVTVVVVAALIILFKA